MTSSQTSPGAGVVNDPRWADLTTRNPQADGAFVYSVATTGIYCRPTCPARRARPENVAFHGSPDEAERAGFRPCKRCKPDQRSPAEEQAALVTELCRFIEAAEHVPTLAELARRAGWSVYPCTEPSRRSPA